MKWISSILVAVLLLQAGYLPCAAQETVILKGDEIDSTKLWVGMYVEVTYYSKKGEKKTITGPIKAVEDDALIIIGKGGWKKNIKYRDIITLMVEDIPRDIIRSGANIAVTPGERVRITAPSVSAKQIIGEVVRVSTDTLVVTAEVFRLMVKGAPNYDGPVKSLLTLHQLICSHCGTRTYEADDHRFGLDLDFLRMRQLSL